MSLPGARRFDHPAFPKGSTDVWPKTYQGILNFGLSMENFHACWDAVGASRPDPSAGFFPTMESLEARDRGAPPYDGLANVRVGLTTHVKVITLTPGKVIFRFAQQGDLDKDGKPSKGNSAMNLPDDVGNAHAFLPFCGAWWTTALGFENMLARVSATYENSALGVAGGKGLGLRDYARRYSAVFTDWSRMEIVGMSRVLRPIRCFMGMGAKLSREFKVVVDGIPLVESETYNDSNVQLYIPNLRGQIGTYLSAPQVWSPEKIDERLSRRIQRMRMQGVPLHERKKHIFESLTGP